MKKITLALAMLVITSCLYAQQDDFSDNERVNYIQPSPEAATLINSVNNAVDLYTGTLHVDVPLYTLKTKSFTIPVGLNYAATGLKVQELAGLAGAGFSIKGGGAITRVVRGLPDEDDKGYSHANGIGHKLSGTLTIEEADQVLRGEMDGEPDLFYFSVPGASGKFVLDHTGKSVLMPYQDITIQPEIGPKSSSNNQWVIKMPNGDSYTFGTYDGTTDVDYTSSKHPYRSEPVEFISTWHLKQMVSSITNDEVTFQYLNGMVTTVTQYHQDISDVTDNSEMNCTNGDLPISTGVRDINTIVTTTPKYLWKVKANKTTVTFDYGSVRSDYPNQSGDYLRKILVSYTGKSPT
ncbi:MAG: hypothetical protein AAF734_05735, partial [Bacteroidota bacterium]